MITKIQRINTSPAVTDANGYNEIYKFDAGKTGFCLGTSLIIGSTLVQLVPGRISDLILYLDSQRHSGMRRPEARLCLTYLTALCNAVRTDYLQILRQHKTHWVAPLIAVAVGGCGLQMAATYRYSHIFDCYKPQTMESNLLLSWGRGLSLVVDFFAVSMAKRGERSLGSRPSIATSEWHQSEVRKRHHNQQK